MSMIDLENAFKLVHESSRSRFIGPRNESLIGAAETALGIDFPPTYRRFLKELGCGNFGSFEIYGLIDENFQESMIPNGVWLTLTERKEADLPLSMMIIGATGDGAYYTIDTSKPDDSNECPVEIWWPGVNKLEGVVAPNFGSFFLSRLRRLIESG